MFRTHRLGRPSQRVRSIVHSTTLAEVNHESQESFIKNFQKNCGSKKKWKWFNSIDFTTFPFRYKKQGMPLNHNNCGSLQELIRTGTGKWPDYFKRSQVDFYYVQKIINEAETSVS